MITNLFNKFSVKNNIFQTNNQEIKLITEKDVEKENDEKERQKLISSYENNEIKNVLVKSFNFEPNINGYEGLLKERTKEIKKGIEYLKTLSEVKVVSRKGDKFTKEILNEICEVIEVSGNDIVNKDKFIKKAFPDNNNVKVYDLFDMQLLGQALLENELNRVITVYGNAVEVTGLISYSKDLTYKEMFDLLKGNKDKLVKVVNGGVFTGKIIYDFNSTIDINTKSLLFLTEEDCNYKKEESCISCAKCLRICPENLNPIKIVNSFRLKEEKEVYELGLNNCIECGLCSYICPSKIEILQKIRVAKSTLNRGK